MFASLIMIGSDSTYNKKNTHIRNRGMNALGMFLIAIPCLQISGSYVIFVIECVDCYRLQQWFEKKKMIKSAAKRTLGQESFRMLILLSKEKLKNHLQVIL